MDGDFRFFLWTVAGIVVLLVIAMRGGLEWLMNLVMRGVLGAVAIFFLNMGLEALGIVSGVGLNAVSVLTTGILGFPGLLALYGIGFYRQL